MLLLLLLLLLNSTIWNSLLFAQSYSKTVYRATKVREMVQSSGGVDVRVTEGSQSDVGIHKNIHLCELL